MNRIVILSFISLVLILVGAIGVIVTRAVSKAASEEYVIVIPDGTGALIEAGQDPNVVPEEIHLVLGRQDVLVIKNQDTIGHQIGDFWVRPGETLRQAFHSPGVYQGQCSIHQNEQIHIIVSNP